MLNHQKSRNDELRRDSAETHYTGAAAMSDRKSKRKISCIFIVVRSRYFWWRFKFNPARADRRHSWRWRSNAPKPMAVRAAPDTEDAGIKLSRGRPERPSPTRLSTSVQRIYETSSIRIFGEFASAHINVTQVFLLLRRRRCAWRKRSIAAPLPRPEQPLPRPRPTAAAAPTTRR
jgi:hypothetical protein